MRSDWHAMVSDADATAPGSTQRPFVLTQTASASGHVNVCASWLVSTCHYTHSQLCRLACTRRMRPNASVQSCCPNASSSVSTSLPRYALPSRILPWSVGQAKRGTAGSAFHPPVSAMVRRHGSQERHARG